HWEYLRPIQETLTIPVVANGEIWTKEDFDICKKVSGCSHFMVGRGAIARPSLGLEIQALLTEKHHWHQIPSLLVAYHRLLGAMNNPTRQAGRIKQWIKLLGRTYPEAIDLFVSIRRLTDLKIILKEISTTAEQISMSKKVAL
ncbi:MAG: tRNA-dihydrouridine synthase, partial [Sneathiella sp.]|nr:tRNA-dihydrouridine synthase [Sneathiella sp.]